MADGDERSNYASKPRRDWKPEFLTALYNQGVVSKACEAADINRATAYRARENDPAFAEAWDEIDERVVDLLEGEGIRRAANGSDRLLEFFLRARRPRIYRENVQVQHSGQVEHVMSLPDDPQELERLAGELRRRRGVVEATAEEVE